MDIVLLSALAFLNLDDCLQILPELFVKLIFYLPVLDLIRLPIFGSHALPNLSKDLGDLPLAELWVLAYDAVSFLLHEHEERRQLLLVGNISVLKLLLCLSVIELLFNLLVQFAKGRDALLVGVPLLIGLRGSGFARC